MTLVSSSHVSIVQFSDERDLPDAHVLRPLAFQPVT